MEAPQPSSQWVVTKDDREAYDKLFQDWDVYHMGFLEGDVAAEVMRRSGLSNEDLEKIWTLSDPGNKGTLDMDEFAVAVHLIYRKLNGCPVPNQLPPEIVSLPTRNFAQSIVTVNLLLSQDAETRENSSAFPQPQQTGVSYLKKRSFPTDSDGANDKIKRLKEAHAKEKENAIRRIKALEELVEMRKQTVELNAVYGAEMAALREREKQLQNQLGLCTNSSLPSLTESPAPTSLLPVVDSNQEETEARAQPPQHSPIVSRAAVPTATQHQESLSQLSVAMPPQRTSLPTPRQASGFPLINQQPMAQQPNRSASTELTPQHSQSHHPHNQFNNHYGPAGQQKTFAPTQKAYEPLGQQVRPQQQLQQHQYEDSPNSQAPAQSKIQAQSHMGGSPSTSHESSSYHMSNHQHNASQHDYGGNYGQSQHSLQEAAPPRTRNALGASEYTSQYPSTYMNEAGAHLYDQERPGYDDVDDVDDGDVDISQKPRSQAAGAARQRSGYAVGTRAHPYGRERPGSDNVNQASRHHQARYGQEAEAPTNGNNPPKKRGSPNVWEVRREDLLRTFLAQWARLARLRDAFTLNVTSTIPIQVQVQVQVQVHYYLASEHESIVLFSSAFRGMSRDLEHADEQTRLLHATFDRQSGPQEPDEDVHSIRSSSNGKYGHQLLFSTYTEETLPYNAFVTVDLLRGLVKDSSPYSRGLVRKGFRHRLISIFESFQGWIMAALIGCLTACVAFLVDIAEATVSDWKLGYCATNIFSTKENCCIKRGVANAEPGEPCAQWHMWVSGFWRSYGVFLGFALSFGIISASATTYLTKANLPVAAPRRSKKRPDNLSRADNDNVGKTMYLASGSGIPEIKAILSGFAIPHYLDFKVLAVKAFGAVFAVATAYLIGRCVPRFRENGRKMRELLSAGCSSGLAVAFGAPIGGVLFSFEEISTHFPRKVLWRAFLSSLVAATVLRALNPTGTGKLVLFETNYGTSYYPSHYLVFVFLGIVGGLFGGVFCKANFLWSKRFRSQALIKDHPVFEVCFVVFVTVLLQYPNPMTREPGDITLKNILVDCRGLNKSWVCEMESRESRSSYIGWLAFASLAKLVLTTITFGCKVPSGIIIPALDAGAFFGRLVGQWITTLSPGIFAMVSAAAFLAGVSRMTISLGVIMFELTGELEYIVPNMIAIIVAKWVSDFIEIQGVYDLAQNVSGLPFLDLDRCMGPVQEQHERVEILIPPEQTMKEISVDIPKHGMVSRGVLDEKLEQLKCRGLIDGGLVLVQNDMLQGYLSEEELESGLNNMGDACSATSRVRLLGLLEEGDFDLSGFVDRTPLTINAKAPMEYAVEMFGKLGLRYICVVEESTGKLVGVIEKKRLLDWLESLKH